MPDSDGEIRQNELNVGDDGNKEESAQREGLSGFLLSLASNATKKLSDIVSVTAETTDAILDKTIIGAFHKEHKKFLQEKHTQTAVPESVVPPWVGYIEEETIQQSILALSVDRRNFICDPPDGVEFHFDFEEMYPVALVMLQEDELLSQMRFAVVPKHVKEDRFWRNYFYRVSLIKQSAQSLETKQQAADKEKSESDVISPDDVHLRGVERKSTTHPIMMTTSKTNEVEDHISTSPAVSEFVSEAFDTCNIDLNDLREEMRLILDNNEKVEGDTSEWQKDFEELFQEDS
ncbi:synapse-associated protein 1-like isoform X3 [Clupea harengus]|nr:synapse-associated protein 1-like isoform X3 [Clupea harengus]XP_031414960.1 synapse-associated protein 1-like isoform X3 [Clupea harengus]XP_031414961.1 synapse-associated protein 1-like isoform X3 [Clupea harengus]